MNLSLYTSGLARRREYGFTLVEILVVVILLAILAAIVLPKFSDASEIARATTLANNLRGTRSQILLFKHQHLGVPPGYPGGDISRSPTAGLFDVQMTQGTNESCSVGSLMDPDFPLGPYLLRSPENPINEKITVEIIQNAQALPAEGDNSHGFIYQPSTMTFKADSPGSDESGTLYFDY